MKYLTINKAEVNLPESWAEVTWGQSCEIITLFEDKEIPEQRFILRIVSILTGLAPKFWEDYTDLPQFMAIANSCAWAFRSDLQEEQLQNLRDKAWRVFTYEGERYELPYDIGSLTAAQFIDANAVQSRIAGMMEAEEIAKNKGEKYEFDINSILDSKRQLFSIYFQALKDGEYNYQNADELDVTGVPYITVVKWADFFLAKMISLQSGTSQGQKLSLTLKTRLLQALKI